MKENNNCFFFFYQVFTFCLVFTMLIQRHMLANGSNVEWITFLSQLSSRTIKVIHVPLNSYNETEFRGPAYNHVIT